MGLRLRYLHHDLELLPGKYTIGRGVECELSLDDPLASREHAVLIVAREGVFIEDLRSRNGVLVNGHKISGRVMLRRGDCITIGAQELCLEGSASGPPAAGVRAPPPIPQHERFAMFEAVLQNADRAFALGRADEAERVLASPLGEVIELVRSGQTRDRQLVDLAARYSAMLATMTGKGAWADYVIEIYALEGRPCPGPVIDELYSALRRVTAIDLDALMAFVDELGRQGHRLGERERFLVQRLEGLVRFASMR